MADELPDDDVFLVTLPIWFLVRLKAVETKPSIKGILRTNHARHGQCPLLFTDLEGADEFRDSKPELTKYVRAALTTPAETLAFLDVVEKGGCKYVAFDTYKERGRFMPIDGFRKYVISKPGSI